MRIVVVGLGYVGLPLAVELAKHFEVIGVDTNSKRIEELESGYDATHEISSETLKQTTMSFVDVGVGSRFPYVTGDVFIITVPTPITESNQPDLSMVRDASVSVGVWLKKGNIVIYESTVYPGVTEEVCIPLLEMSSSLKHLTDFNVGYSPERINPGDKVHTLTTTVKIVSGDTLESLEKIDSIYNKITTTYKASSIKVAEAAKVIENTQRDINIAFMNELSQIFNRLDVDTNEVIDAASTKWNFQAFRPGLVGGHCISVDPYYLSHKAAGHGLITDVILSARRVNDSMPTFIVEQLVKLMTQRKLLGDDARIVILGCTFKENVPDTRNSKVFKIIDLLREYDLEPIVFDPLADKEQCASYGYQVESELRHVYADAVVYAVAHDQFVKQGWEVANKVGLDRDGVMVDIKGILDTQSVPENIKLWRP